MQYVDNIIGICIVLYALFYKLGHSYLTPYWMPNKKCFLFIDLLCGIVYIWLGTSIPCFV